MDMVDSPGYGQRFVKPQKSKTLQSELQLRLQERRRQGLAAEMTSEDSDVPEDNEPGSDDDFDAYAQYRTDPSHQRRNNRPSSAKRRSPLDHHQQADISLGDTLRPGAADRFIKKGGSSSMPPLSSPKTPPRDRYSMEMPSLTSPKLSPKGSSGMTSGMRPYGDKGGVSPKLGPSPPAEGLLPKGGKAAKGKGLQKEAPMSAADQIFGRKTPTNEVQGKPVQDPNKPWQAPNLRKASPILVDDVDRSGGDSRVSPTSGLRGRTTPSLESSLRPISETPSPRPRHLSGGSTTLPRTTKAMEAEVPRPRPRNTTDIFGKTSTVEVELSDDEDNQKHQRFSHSPGRKTPTELHGGRKTPTGRLSGVGGRKTPTGDLMGRKTPTNDQTGRKTPVTEQQGRKTPTRDFTAGRRTPTGDAYGRKSPTSNATTPGQRSRFTKQGGREAQPPPVKKEASLMDFLVGDTSDQSKKRKEERKPKLLRDTSNDSIEDEFEQANRFLHGNKKVQQQYQASARTSLPKQEVEPKKGKSSDDLWSSRNADNRIPVDQSSVCADIEYDPNLRISATADGKTVKGGSQADKMTNGQVNDEIIDMVAEEQEIHGPGRIKPIDPHKEKAKTEVGKHPVHKPKPRHSLPGTPSHKGSLDDSVLDSTRSIRDAIYAEWRKEKMKSAKQKLSEDNKQKEEVEKKKKKEKVDKFLENKASYNAWMEMKQDTFVRDKARERRKEEDKKLKEEREKQQKFKEAAKNFEIWNEKKAEVTKEKVREKKMVAHEEQRDKKREKDKREKLSETAFRGWKTKKDNLIKTEEKTQKTMTKQQSKEQNRQKEKQEEDALQKYHQWLDQKDKQKKHDIRQRQYGSTEELEYRPAWSPANRTIPFGR